MTRIETVLTDCEIKIRSGAGDEDINARTLEVVRLIRTLTQSAEADYIDADLLHQLQFGLTIAFKAYPYMRSNGAIRSFQVFCDVGDIVDELELIVQKLLNVERENDNISNEFLHCDKALILNLRKRGELFLALFAAKFFAEISQGKQDYFGLYFLESDGSKPIDSIHGNTLRFPIPELEKISPERRREIRKFISVLAVNSVQNFFGSHTKSRITASVHMACAAFNGDDEDSRELLQHLKQSNPTWNNTDTPGDFASYLIPLAENQLYESKKAECPATDSGFVIASWLFLLALEHRRLEFGEGHSAFATCLDGIARCLRVLNFDKLATHYLQAAYTIKKDCLGVNHIQVRELLTDLFDLLEKNNRRDELIDLYDDVIQNLRAINESHFAVSQLKALYVLETGDFAHAVSLWSDLVDDPEVGDLKASALSNLGVALHQSGRYAEALSCLQKAYDLESQLGSAPSEMASIANNLGGVYLEVGDFENCFKCIEESLNLRKIAHGEDSIEYSQALNNLGETYTRSGEFGEALPLLNKSLELRRKLFGESSPWTASTLFSIASLYRQIGDFSNSMRLHSQILKIRNENPNLNAKDIAESFNDIALLHSCLGDHSKAKEMHKQALYLWRNNFGEDHPNAILSMQNLGTACMDLGELDEAQGYIEKAITLAESLALEPLADLSYMYNNLAAIRCRQLRFDESVNLYLKAIKIRQATFSSASPDLAASHLDISLSLAKLNRWEEVKDHVFQSVRITNQTIQQVSGIASERQRLDILQSSVVQLEYTISLVAEKFSSDFSAVEFCADTLLRRKALSLEAGVVQRLAVVSGKYPTLAEKLAHLLKLRERTAHIMLSPQKELSTKNSEQLLNVLLLEQEKLEAELAQMIPEMRFEQQMRSVDWRAIAKSLPEDTCVIDFIDASDFWAEENVRRYFAIVITSAPSLELVSCGPVAEIDELIGSLRNSMEDALRTSTSADMKIGIAAPILKRLTDLIWNPFSKIVSEKKKILLSPDGELCTLPFEILQLKEPEYLLDKFQISYLSTGRDYLRPCMPSSSVEDSIVIAHPDYDLKTRLSWMQSLLHSCKKDARLPNKPTDPENNSLRELRSSGKRFTELKGSKAEATAIAKQLKVTPWLGRDASKTRLCAIKKSPKILHIATHGFYIRNDSSSPFGFKPENSLLKSGLALAGANCWLSDPSFSESDNGILNGQDVCSLDLSNTRLVVLSGCETGLGDYVSGEGLFGLRRAFILAGAESLVTSLWSIPDKEMVEFMNHFYRNFLLDMNVSKALTESKVAIRKKYPHPAIWGSFISLGVS